jgi:putative addiction module killer protein
MLKIEQYQDEDGGIPFRAWFAKLRDVVAKTAILNRIDRLTLGNFGNCRDVGNGISELKIDVGAGYRVYVAHRGERLVILLYGGNKATQSKDIELARKYWTDWKRRQK